MFFKNKSVNWRLAAVFWCYLCYIFLFCILCFTCVFYLSYFTATESEKCKFAVGNAAAQIWCYWKFFEFSTNICRSTSPAWIKQKHERNHSETSVPKCIQPNYGYLSSPFIEFSPRDDLIRQFMTKPIKKGPKSFPAVCTSSSYIFAILS